MCVSVLPVCLACASVGNQKRVLSLGQVLVMVVNAHVGARDQGASS